MRISRIIILCIIVLALGYPIKAQAGSETRCYAYHDANKLAYCLAVTKQGAAIRTTGMEPGTAQLYTVLNTQPVVPPTVIPAGGIYYGSYYAQPHPVTAVANVASNMLAAAAWTYNWRHGYIGANGLWGAAYLMNYPW